MKRKNVDEVYQDNELLEYIIIYREFVNNFLPNINEELDKLNIEYTLTCRLKQINSIQYKLENYVLNREKGKIPLKKCLNDILGFRIIFESQLDYNYIFNFIKEKYNNLKYINSDKKDYKAIHIYFGNEDNKNFQWELQIWDKKHKESNLKSHKQYKQDYIVWEKNKLKEVNKK